ncbi:MAG TPA: CopD family protein [Burkholderiales bacterium]
MTYYLLLTLHLLGATIWVGGHIVLAAAILPRALGRRDPAIVRDFESGFEWIGLPALLLQAGTGVWLSYYWLPRFGTWFALDSTISRLITLKLALLVVTILIALHARLRIIPRLDAARLPALAVHIVLVTILSIAFVVVGVGIRTRGFL